MNKKIEFTLLSLYMVLFLGCVSTTVPVQNDNEIPDTANIITVEAEGLADIRPAGISEATDRAYIEAQRKALELALGKIYSARTVVESGRFIEQTVMAQVKGYIRSYDKIAGPQVQDFPGTDEKVVWVKIKAHIGMDKLKEDTLALEEMQNRLGRPDVAVVIEDKSARQVVSDKLKESKFTVKELEGPGSDYIVWAGNSNIELIIDGEVKASGGGQIMSGVDLKSYQADVSLKAINVIDGEVLALSTVHDAKPHINEVTGKAIAIESASGRAADKLISSLLKAWENVLNNGNNIYLEVSGLDLKKETDFRKILERYIRGLNEIHSKGMKDDIFTYKLKYLGDAKQFAKELDALNINNVHITIDGYKMNKVESKIEWMEVSK
ncbi:hypothetical protein ACFLTD_05040 [Elusimicrobiota bacterium]